MEGSGTVDVGYVNCMLKADIVPEIVAPFVRPTDPTPQLGGLPVHVDCPEGLPIQRSARRIGRILRAKVEVEVRRHGDATACSEATPD